MVGRIHSPSKLTHANQTYARARVLHQPLISRNCRKIAIFEQNYERAMVHEAIFKI